MNCYGTKPRSFLNKVPSGLLPVLEISKDGNTQILTESLDIMRFLASLQIDENNHKFLSFYDKFSDKQFMGTVNKQLRLERQFAGVWLNLIRGQTSSFSLFGQNRSELEFLSTLDLIEEALDEIPGSFFLGDKLSLVDCVYAPFIERAFASVLYFRGIHVLEEYGEMRYKNIMNWINELELIPEYMSGKGDAYSHARGLPPQIGRCNFSEKGKHIAKRIDEEPLQRKLQVHNGIHYNGQLFYNGFTKSSAKYEAVACLVHNKTAVICDSLKGVTGELDEAGIKFLKELVELGFYAVCEILMLIAQDKVKSMEECELLFDREKYVTVFSGLEKSVKQNVIDALKYECKRVCVPRDMEIHAKIEFQSGINWVVQFIQDCR